MRTLVPAETLVYLETNDLAAALQPIVDSKPFMEVAKSKPAFSALNGVQLAVAVTGFETSEEKLTNEHSVGRVQPHFVAVADTHAWNYQAVAFAEKKLGSFVASIYDSEPKLERSEKNGGKYFTWTATDGRKAYALVIDSLIYFGNDETAIDKCLAVKRGEADNIAKAGKVQMSVPGTLASGYVGSDGIAQIANIVGLKFASEAGEDSEVQSAIAGILPQIVRNSVVEVSWAATKYTHMIRDEFKIVLKPEVAKVFNETLNQSDFQATDLEDYVPTRAASISRYVLKDPLIAWRSVVLTVQSQTDPIGGKMIGVMAESLFEPYGIANPALFLGSVTDHRILTTRVAQESDEIVAVARIRDVEQLKKSLTKDIDFSKPGETVGDATIWKSRDAGVTAAITKDVILVGDSTGVGKCLEAKLSGNDFTKRERFKQFEITTATALTISNELGPDPDLLNVFSEAKNDASPVIQTSFTVTHFDESGINRSILSDTGLIGSIIAQLNEE